MSEICENCKWWDKNHRIEGGTCQRRAPITDAETNSTMWPVTLEDQWCGEFEEDKS